MKPNIGIVNAMVRITAGFTILAWATAKLVRNSSTFNNRSDTSVLLCVALGAMKVAEGITRFCPLTELAEEGYSNLKNNQNNQQQHTYLPNHYN
ncbi:YgaP family membrane protein [Desertibacillus haloalkaliphilus]|uniref:YgaP family membrane protein n=1 Tax=Desertibacillus haloalkaliphilus TaxID=1328930 RepID=UPI001C263833|nr:DUF2892 domain-containing protein [Desertibacillus haloalkaliphilus]MBU8906396.1 DUF2892 domain-containing protein [Desertibacillus haloalkaliphilus]